MVAGFIPEWWPTSNRNGGRLRVGKGGRNKSEFAPDLLGKRLGRYGLRLHPAKTRFVDFRFRLLGMAQGLIIGATLCAARGFHLNWCRTLRN